jgi:hypothetical protein
MPSSGGAPAAILGNRPKSFAGRRSGSNVRSHKRTGQASAGWRCRVVLPRWLRRWALVLVEFRRLISVRLVVQLYPGPFPRSKQLFDVGVGELFGFQGVCALRVRMRVNDDRRARARPMRARTLR